MTTQTAPEGENYRMKYFQKEFEVRHLKKIQKILLDQLELEKCRYVQASVRVIELECELEKLKEPASNE